MIALIVVYIIFLIAYSIYSYFALYHLQEFGHIGDASKIVIYLYIIASVVVVVSTLSLVIGSMASK